MMCLPLHLHNWHIYNIHKLKLTNLHTGHHRRRPTKHCAGRAPLTSIARIALHCAVQCTEHISSSSNHTHPHKRIHTNTSAHKTLLLVATYKHTRLEPRGGGRGGRERTRVVAVHRSATIMIKKNVDKYTRSAHKYTLCAPMSVNTIAQHESAYLGGACVFLLASHRRRTGAKVTETTAPHKHTLRLVWFTCSHVRFEGGAPHRTRFWFVCLTEHEIKTRVCRVAQSKLPDANGRWRTNARTENVISSTASSSPD